MPARPADDDVVPIEVQLAWQQDYCRNAGAPTAALILQAVQGDLEKGGICSGLLPGQTRFGDLIGLRIMAAVHLLAIERLAPAVALHAPTLGGMAPDASANPARERIRFRAAVIEAIAAHADRVRHSLGQVPQTNEVGRSIPLRIALSQIAASQIARAQTAATQIASTQTPYGKPAVRLLEIGASAGLNLRADHLPGRADLEAGPMPRIIERLGCDLNPIDPASTEGRARLTSYVWMDDVERFERLRHALTVADRIPAQLVQQDAVAFVRGLHLRDGTTTVLWHSAMWIYLAGQSREQIEQEILRLGSQAQGSRPFWHVSWEWSSDPSATSYTSSEATFRLVARRWVGASGDGEARVLATGSSHGGVIHLVDESAPTTG